MEMNIVYEFVVTLRVILGSVGFGSLVALLIQIGKIANIVKDDSSQNYRLAFALLIAVFVTVASLFGYSVGIEQIDSTLASISELGVLLLPLITWLVDYFAKRFYNDVLSNRAFIGKSYSGIR